MHLGTLLTLSSIVVLATEVLAALTLFRLTRAVDGRPGGHFLRILTRTISIVIIGQALEVVTDISLDAAPMTQGHEAVIVLEAINLLLIFVAIIWAWWDLTRSDYQR